MRRVLDAFLRLVGAATLIGLAVGIALLIGAGYWMRVNDAPRQADYIIPLAGDSGRLIKAAELYHQGFAPVILLSNSVELPVTGLDRLRWEIGFPNLDRDEYHMRLLTVLGAQASVAGSFGYGHVSTVEEAEALREYLKGKPARLLLVTSPTHARRAKMIFEDILPHCEITMVATDEGGFGTDWWKDQYAAQNLVLEFAKTAHYMLGGVFRSTDSEPGI